MSMSASDFLSLYEDAAHKDAYDAVATVFFLDTAPNPIRYIETIRNCLKSGGIWTNIGPLLWHFENNPPSHPGGRRDANAPSSKIDASSSKIDASTGKSMSLYSP
jgi:carnosine N-methyltransferase